MSLDARLQSVWYGPAWRSLPLWPLALLYRLILALRAMAYRTGLLRVEHVDVPVIVVGNLTVGGTGKTPVAAWLARQLEARGRRVGVVLRGYGGSHRGAPRVVAPTDDPSVTGDEALVHARRGVHAVVIGADRVAAARLAAEQGAEVVVCDDGLQHVRLVRDYEIAVVDGARGLGNRWLLPAGPLREPACELESVHAVVVTHRGGKGARISQSVRLCCCRRSSPSATQSISSLASVARSSSSSARPTCTRLPVSVIPTPFSAASSSGDWSSRRIHCQTTRRLGRGRCRSPRTPLS